MGTRSFFFLLGMLALLGCSFPSNDTPIKLSYADVVNRLTDMKALSKLPNEGEKSAMWSSYDRESKIDSVTGEYFDWDANIDGLEPQYIRKEEENEVLAEMEGPGAIVRIWSASPKHGKVKIYIDDNPEPIINESFIDFFSPSIPAFDYPELVYETNAKGYNNYVPITYQKRCKIVAEPGWGQYYHFNYITFPKGTQVEGFRPEPSEEGIRALQKTNSFFAHNLGQYPGDPEGLEKKTAKVELAPNKSVNAITFQGQGAIAILRAKFNNLDSTRIRATMRKTILEIRWDGEEDPSVWAPLGDFFGTSPGWNNYRTLPMGMTDEWAYSYWYMPFADGAEITLINHNGHSIDVDLEVHLDDPQGNRENMARFHAKWHRDLAPLEKERWPDWTLLETQGKGRFVGTHLLVWNPKGGSSDTGGPGHYWWGEGDEKFFIDGEEFPSTFGTGTEDYFGYAWCDPSVFVQAFHSQTLNNDNMGYQPMNRWQIIDNVPFQNSFDGYLEKYFPNELPTQYATVVYWYLNPGGVDNLSPLPTEELYGYEIPYEVFRKEGVKEAENFIVEDNSGGWVNSNAWAHETLFKSVSGHKILMWFAVKEKSNRLVAGFNMDQGGTYDVYANIVKQPDGGEFDIKINKVSLGTHDFNSHANKKMSERIYLGKIGVESGSQVLEFDYSGENEFPKAMRLDYLELKKI